MIYTDMNTKIYTDIKTPQGMKLNNVDLLYSDLTYKVRGALFAVYNELGFGHKEQVYQKALVKEFSDRDIAYKREITLPVLYGGDVVGSYRPDFVISDKVILELKAVEFVPKAYQTQLLNYLKTTGYALGLLVNFGAPKLYIKRLVFTHPRKSDTTSVKIFKEGR